MYSKQHMQDLNIEKYQQDWDTYMRTNIPWFQWLADFTAQNWCSRVLRICNRFQHVKHVRLPVNHQKYEWNYQSNRPERMLKLSFAKNWIKHANLKVGRQRNRNLCMNSQALRINIKKVNKGKFQKYYWEQYSILKFREKNWEAFFLKLGDRNLFDIMLTKIVHIILTTTTL